MKVLDLQCALGHRFEVWFGSEEDFQSQRERGLLSCPLCGDGHIEKMLSAPRLNLAGSRAPAEATGGDLTAAHDETQQLHAAWTRLAHHIAQATQDVGDRFAAEARRIHYGEVDAYAIRGRATVREAQALQEEGISVVALPFLEHLNQPLH